MQRRRSFGGLEVVSVIAAPAAAAGAAVLGKWPTWFVVTSTVAALLVVALGVWHEQVGRALGGPFENFLSQPHSPLRRRRCWTIIAIVVCGSLIALLARAGDWAWLTLSVGVGAGIAYWGFKVCPKPDSKRALAAIVVGGFAMSLAANFFVGVVSGQTTVAGTTQEWAKIDTKLNELLHGQQQIQQTQQQQGQEQERQGQVQQAQGKTQERTLDNSEKLLAIEAIKANPNLSEQEKFQQILALTSPSPAASSVQASKLELPSDIKVFLERMAATAPLIDQVRTANALGNLDEAKTLRERYIAEMTAARNEQDYAAFVAFGDTEWLAERYNQAGEWYEKALALHDDNFEVVNKALLSLVSLGPENDDATATMKIDKWLQRGHELIAESEGQLSEQALAFSTLVTLRNKMHFDRKHDLADADSAEAAFWLYAYYVRKRTR